MRKQGVTLPRTKWSGKAARFAALSVLVALFGAGLPHLLAMALPHPPAEPADAILVFTGGENRIQEGYRAWKAGMGKELAILGTGGILNPERIFPGRPVLAPEDLRKLYVENWSENTLENAYSAKGLILQRNFSKVILMTSAYHVPRAYLTLRAVLPGNVTVSAIPVRTEWKGSSAIARAVRLYFVEGWKYWWYRMFLVWE